MHKVDIKVEGEKILRFQTSFRLLEKGAPFVEFTHSMLKGPHEMHRYITPVMAQIIPIVIPRIDITSSVTIEPFHFRVKLPAKEAWNDLLPSVIGVMQRNVNGKVGVKVVGSAKWPMRILKSRG